MSEVEWEIICFANLNRPTRAPTTDPTTDPTQQPTNEPTPIFCDMLYLELTDFDAFDAGTLNTTTTLQEDMESRTHFAIAQSANISDHSVGPNEFDVVFQRATGTLSIQQSICAFDEGVLKLLLHIVNESATDIASLIKSDLMENHHSESVVVTISLNEFGLYFQNLRF